MESSQVYEKGLFGGGGGCSVAELGSVYIHSDAQRVGTTVVAAG